MFQYFALYPVLGLTAGWAVEQFVAMKKEEAKSKKIAAKK